jgi:hypothetical protein
MEFPTSFAEPGNSNALSGGLGRPNYLCIINGLIPIPDARLTGNLRSETGKSLPQKPQRFPG